MPWEIARDCLLFCALVLGGGLALAPGQENIPRTEAWCIGVGWTVAALGGVVFFVHWLQWPLPWIALGPTVILLLAVVRWRQANATPRDESVREMLVTWAGVAAGSLALLACIFSYSGGTWMGDWEEHFHRPLVLLRLRAEGGFFPGFSFTSRPPLANAAEAALLWFTDGTFSRHQTFLLLLNSLAFLPVALWAHTFGGGRAAAACAGLLLLVNPLFLHNTTYAWTKLITVFFVLTGLHVLLARGYARNRTVMGFALLALGMLTHYSACVWTLTFGLGWIVAMRSRWRDREFRITAGLALAVGGAIMAPWALFAVSRYGLVDTLTSNPSYAASAHLTWGENLLSSGPKLWNSVVPHPLRSFDRSMMDQSNPWTWFRDQVFLVYQANLFGGVGGAGLLLLAATALRPAWRPHPPLKKVWWVTGLLTVVVGTAVHGDVDRWGMAQVCLQPLMLLAIALAAAQVPRLWRDPAPILGKLALGLALIDYLLGVVLHYTATALQLNRPAGQNLFDYVNGLSAFAAHNLTRKIHYRQDFFMDRFDFPWWTALTVGIAITVLCALRARRLGRS